MKNPVLVELGKKIKSLRTARDISQEQLALQSGLDYSYVGRIERGENNPTFLTLLAMANTLNVSVKDICCEAG